MIYSLIDYLVIPLVLTIAFEVIIALIIRFTKRNELKMIVLINLLTNPVLQLILIISAFLGLRGDAFQWFLWIIELSIIIVEFYILYYVFKRSRQKTYILLLSFCINAFSFTMGLLFIDEISLFIYRLV